MVHLAWIGLVALVAPATAEFRQISIRYSGEPCDSCSLTLERVMRRNQWVENVSVDPYKGVIALSLKSGNKLAIGRVRDEIKRVGFTPGEARVTLRGTVMKENGSWVVRSPALPDPLKVEISKDGMIKSAGGRSAEMEGSMMPPEGGAGDVLVLRSLRTMD